jgi:hypothetical protein
LANQSLSVSRMIWYSLISFVQGQDIICNGTNSELRFLFSLFTDSNCTGTSQYGEVYLTPKCTILDNKPIYGKFQNDSVSLHSKIDCDDQAFWVSSISDYRKDRIADKCRSGSTPGYQYKVKSLCYNSGSLPLAPAISIILAILSIV